MKLGKLVRPVPNLSAPSVASAIFLRSISRRDHLSFMKAPAEKRPIPVRLANNPGRWPGRGLAKGIGEQRQAADWFDGSVPKLGGVEERGLGHPERGD